MKKLSKTLLISLLLATNFIIGTKANDLVASTNSVENDSKPIGIVSALGLETSYLRSRLKDVKKEKIMGREYYSGKLNGKNVVVAQVGIGAINASVGTAILINQFKPSAVIMTGVAGGTDKTVPGDIIIGSKVTFYDLGSLSDKGKFTRMASFTPDSEFSGNNVKHAPIFYNADKKLLEAATEASKTSKFKILNFKGVNYSARPVNGIITTSEIFNEYPKKVNEMMKSTGCIAFDMECAGPAQVCYNQKVPFMTIKAISDNGSFEMFNALQEKSAENAEILVENMIKNL